VARRTSAGRTYWGPGDPLRNAYDFRKSLEDNHLRKLFIYGRGPSRRGGPLKEELWRVRNTGGGGGGTNPGRDRAGGPLRQKIP
jgi:hypothetical protein